MKVDSIIHFQSDSKILYLLTFCRKFAAGKLHNVSNCSINLEKREVT